MSTTQIEKITIAIELLSEVERFNDFIYGNNIKITTQNELFECLDRFSLTISPTDILINTISLVRETFYQYIAQNSTFQIGAIDKSKVINEQIVVDFKYEISLQKTNQLFFQKLPRKYKTYSENIAFMGYDFNPILPKYIDCNHPYIYDILSEAYNNGGLYSVGVPLLIKGLKYALRTPNIYWDSRIGLMGCAFITYQLQYLLGKNGFDAISEFIPDFKEKILSLIFLLLSRAIEMDNNDIHAIDLYNNRAMIIRDYSSEYMIIFNNIMLGINTDIQYMSDKCLSYDVAVANGVAELVEDVYWDSLKMYRNGGDFPNDSGGYLDIEDGTWDDLINRGKLRSIMIAQDLLGKFKKGQYDFRNDEISLIKDYLEAKFVDLPQKKTWINSDCY